MKKALATLILSVLAASAGASGNVDAGKALAAKYACAACHGADFSTPIDPSYPRLAGQHRDYLEHALVAYKRADGPNGRNNAIMTGQVKPLRDQDIKDLAAYLSSLPTHLTDRAR
jgi:cytochrome c553